MLTPDSEPTAAQTTELPPGPARVLPLALFVWLFAQVAATIAFVTVAEDDQVLEDLTGAEVFSVVLPLQLVLLTGSFGIAAAFGSPWSRLRLPEIRVGEFLASIGFGVAAQIAIALLYVPIIEAFGEELTAASELADSFSGAELALLALMTTIGAPVAEEVFFRGLVQGSFERSFAPWIAIVITAALFSASHFQLLEAPPLFAFGLFVGWWCHRTGRVSSAIAFHMGFNALSTIALIADRV